MRPIDVSEPEFPGSDGLDCVVAMGMVEHSLRRRAIEARDARSESIAGAFRRRIDRGESGLYTK